MRPAILTAAVAFSSSSSSSSLSVYMSEGVLRPLQTSGCVRVVVTQQSTGKVLLDQTGPVVTDPPTAATPVAAPGQEQQGKPITVTMAGLPASLAVCGQLAAADGGASAGCNALLVTLLQGALPQDDHGNDDVEQSKMPVGLQVAAVGSSSVVLAQMPLLVLPGTAQTELQGLSEVLREAGLSCCEVYQQLLPLLQDWAAFMALPFISQASGQCLLHSTKGSAIDVTAAVIASKLDVEHEQWRRARLHAALFSALASEFNALDLSECYSLLVQQQWQHSCRQGPASEVYTPA
jgi:hypothetical protein